MHSDIDLRGPLKAALDLIVYLWGTLSQIGPRFRIIEITMLVGSLRGPDDTGACASGIEAGMGFVAFVRLAELTMGFGAQFCWSLVSNVLVVK